MQQAQQYQLEVARQQQQQQQATTRRNSLYSEPQTAGPTVSSFPRQQRASHAEQLKAQLHLNSKINAVPEEPVPMTAALGGKFGGRLNPNATSFRFGGQIDEEESVSKPVRNGASPPNNTPVTPNYTTVISGGTALGVATTTKSAPATSGMSPSKSDTALSWRRGSVPNTVINTNRAASIDVRITPPPGERVSPPPQSAHPMAKARPQPLRFSVTMHDTPTIAIPVDTSDSDATEDADDVSSSSSNSVPTTPPTDGSEGSCMPLSPREVASKRLYEGLGLGRPAPHSVQVQQTSFPGLHGYNTSTLPGANTFQNRVASQPMRQPRGPPSGVDELGPKNFASRIRRKAIGGLGAMLDARVNRREIEAF
jgi:hypothetical protein